MSHTIPAIFDAGVFRPLEPVDLAEGTQVLVQLESSTPGISDEVDEETRQAWRDYLDRMKSLPERSSTSRPAEATKDEMSPAELSRQQAAIEEMLAEIESLPIEEPDDGFSGRDHDKILYGGR